MKENPWNLVLAAALAIAGLQLAGCYTQLGTVQDDTEEYGSADSSSGYGAEQGVSYDDYWSARTRFYFGYYYPTSYMFGMSFGFWDPWYAWPGQYPWYYAGYAGWYGGWYYPPGYAPGYWYPVGGYPAPAPGYTYNTGRRTFGNTRGGGSTRMGYGTVPVRDGGVAGRGVVRTAGTGAERRPPTAVSSSRASGGRHYPPAGGGAREYQREYRRPPELQPRRVDTGRVSRPGVSSERPSYRPPPSRESSPASGGGRSTEGRSYSPPASAGHAAPSGGSAPSGGGSRDSGRHR